MNEYNWGNNSAIYLTNHCKLIIRLHCTIQYLNSIFKRWHGHKILDNLNSQNGKKSLINFITDSPIEYTI